MQREWGDLLQQVLQTHTAEKYLPYICRSAADLLTDRDERRAVFLNNVAPGWGGGGGFGVEEEEGAGIDC
jgi:hypothetical protein